MVKERYKKKAERSRFGKMKVIAKQWNSRMCVICGLNNPFGVKAEFYNMEDGSVVSPFQFSEVHQSYPGRVHGGLITAMLDELGLRAVWINEEGAWGVTMSLETKFRKPVPYGAPLFAKGIILSSTPKFLKSEAHIYDIDGNDLASAELKYIKLKPEIISDVDYHEEMCYHIEDGVTELDCP